MTALDQPVERPHAGFAYRRDIDGLRALAVLPVILFHAGVSAMSGGFVGVDVFFVISGFLITGIMHREMAQRRFSILKFYERRIRRILPNLLAMMAVTSAVACVILIPLDLYRYAQSVVATLAFAANVYFYLRADYFAPDAQQLPLLHTWSLGVEEQYYLLFPLILLVLLRAGAAWLGRLLWVIALASFGLSVHQVATAPTAAFYLPFARLWELMVGSLLAVRAVPALCGQAVREATAWAGLVAIAVAVFLFDELTPFPGAAALLPCLGAAAILHANDGAETIVGRLLATPVPVFIGLVSYSLYIWHWPLIVFTRYALQRELSAPEVALVAAAMVAVAVLAWWLVERPSRGRDVRFGPLAVKVAVIATALASVAFALVMTGGWPARYEPALQPIALASLDTDPFRLPCDRPSLDRLRSGNVCLVGAVGKAPSFAVIGDSFGDAILPGIVAGAERAGRAGLVLTNSGCAPLLGVDEPVGFCRERTKAAFALVRRTPSIRTVLLVGRWPTMISGHRFGLFGGRRVRLIDDAAQARSEDGNEAVVERGLARSIAALAPARTALVAGLVEQRVHVPQAATLRLRFGGDVGGLARSDYDARQARTRALLARAARRWRFDIVEATPIVCGARSCPILAGGRALFVDDNHLSRTGALRLAPLFEGVLLKQ